MSKLLIQVSDIAEYRPISKEISTDRISPFIREAQENDLRDLFGELLYQDFMAKVDSTLDPMYDEYQKLYRGDTYVYQGNQYIYDGIVPMLCYLSLARYAPNATSNFTRFGMTKKSGGEAGETMTVQEIDNIATELRAIGQSYGRKVKDYLERRSAFFPKYGGTNPNHSNSGIKFFY